jgi:hypothetical protein
MKPTKFLTLLMPTVIAWSFVYVAVRLITLNGGSIPVATNTVLVTLPAIAVLELVFAWPVLRYSRELKKFVAGDVRPKRVDPFYATKVLALAKATSIAGALFLGAAIALVLMQLGAPVVPDSILLNFIALLESVALIAVALHIERACKIREPGDSKPQGTETGRSQTGSTESSPA